jgi:branched-chain amino acid transport system permease protein
MKQHTPSLVIGAPAHAGAATVARASPWTSWLGLLAVGVVLSAVAFMLGSYQTDVYRKMLLWITLALSYNFLFGIAGQVAFSHFAFYGVGAYAIVILLFQVGLPLPLAIVAGIALCVVLALVVAIPSTRLEGFYLALATLAFAQLFLVVLNEGGKVTGGAGGLASYRLPDVFGVRITGPWYTVVIVALLLGTYAVLRRLDRSWFGRACRAVRDNAEAAQAMGIDVARTKIIAYALTSAMAGVAGMVYAFVDNTVNPPIFGLENVFLLLFMVIVGGSGRLAGAILGAVLLYLLPFVLSPLIGHHHALVFGVVMVAVVMFQPKGLIGLWDRFARKGRT